MHLSFYLFMAFNIGIIDVNDYEVKEGFTKESIEKDITPYISFDTADSSDDMFAKVIEHTNMKENQFGDAFVCRDTDKEIYQIWHFNYEDNQMADEMSMKTFNGICSYMSPKRQLVHGKGVIIKNIITENGTCVLGSITKKEIMDIFYTNVMHKAILLDPDPKEIIFCQSPMELLHEHDVKDFKWFELPFLKHNLAVFIKKDPTDTRVNKLATRLTNTKVIGPAIITSRVSEYIFDDLTLETFNKIIKVAGGELINRKLTKDEQDTSDRINGIPIIRNKHMILNKRIDRYKNKCNGCGGEFEKLKRCSGCYRMAYHSRKCQREHWKDHKEKCLFKDDPFNYNMTNTDESEQQNMTPKQMEEEYLKKMNAPY